MLSPPTRIENDIYEAAKTHGALASRSAAQQIAHWARVGRQLELAPSTAWPEIVRVLEGDADYDALGDREQAIVRAVWSERVDDLAARVDLTNVFIAQQRKTASIAADDGALVTIELDAGTPVTRRSPRTKRAAKK